jgi:hypothetical protein
VNDPGTAIDVPDGLDACGGATDELTFQLIAALARVGMNEPAHVASCPAQK